MSILYRIIISLPVLLCKLLPYTNNLSFSVFVQFQHKLLQAICLLLSHLPMYIVSLLYKQAFSIGFKAGCYSRKILKTKKSPPPPPYKKKTPKHRKRKKKWFNPTFMKNKAPTSNSLLTVAARLINIKTWSPASNKYMYWWVNLSSDVHMSVPVYKEQRDNSNNSIVVVTDTL